VQIPETRYAKTADGLHIGYQVVGDGAVDLVFVPFDYSNIEAMWDIKQFGSFVRAVAAHARVLLLDRRGIGTSDRPTGGAAFAIESMMDDIRAVMEAAGSERAFLFAIESAATLCFPFAATYPDRTAGIIVFGGFVRGSWAPDYPWAWTHQQFEEYWEKIDQGWGSPAFVEDLVDWLSPSMRGDPEFLRAVGRNLRLSASPGDAIARDRASRDTDVRHVLPSIQVPTLVLHRLGDKVEPVEQGRYIASHVPGATLVELPGDDHLFPFDDLVPHIARFIESVHAEEAEFDRVLATVLFTDIVGSTARAAELGDRAWRALLERHHATVRAMLGRYRGKEIDTAGDGFFATFDGPARAVRCAQAIVEALRPLGLEVRAGVHTGEVETIDGKVGGMAVVIGARVAAVAGAGEILVSQTVKDLVAGSGLTFEDRGARELKGVPDEWRVYAVA
jgi:class 3 adenylate cyclase